jgi:hypothetical protein
MLDVGNQEMHAWIMCLGDLAHRGAGAVCAVFFPNPLGNMVACYPLRNFSGAYISQLWLP